DCIVSPANSFGIMDGGFDLVLSRAFQGRSADVYALTDHVQATLGTRWGGFAPAGTCTLVPLPAGVSGREGNKWGTHTLAVLPTMKEPEWVGWNRELVYNGMWSLLCEIGRWNEEAEGAGRDPGGSRCLEAKREGEKNGQERIERVVMTGLGTGTGGVSAARCGRQMVLAVKHYLQGLPEKVRW
ncbi:macro domain-like protein, partial [Dichomitus squalens LYAD-421 SS1]